MNSTGVVVPCFMGGEITLNLIQELESYVDLIVLVDDKCPLKTGEKVIKNNFSKKVHVIFNSKNMGVGGSTKKGFQWLIDQGCEIILKMDADYQMYPSDIPKMINPIIRKEFDATKGNRFTNIETLAKMPRTRLVGNIFLSYISKLSTGYWEIFDPNNGFIAFSINALKEINFNKADDRFFFETEILFRCSLQNISIRNVSIDSNYNNHFSSLKPLKQIFPFFIKNIKLLFKRIIYQYFLLDFNVGSIELLLSIVFAFLSIFYGFYLIIQSNITDMYSSAGQASFFSIISILSMQFFLSFIFYDCSVKVFLRKK